MRTRVKFRFAAVLMVLFVSDLPPAFGQTEKDEVIQKLIARVEALEREVSELKQGAAPVPAVATSPPASVLERAAPSETADVTPVSEKRFSFHGYADVGFLRNQDGDGSKRFALGEVDLFATARVSPRVTALMEAVLETDNQVLVSSVPLNLERLLLQYRYNDYFNVDIGSYRTAIGYYSTAYLRGSWLQTAMRRPRLFEFEDDGGFLPLHNVGVSMNGELPSGRFGLSYVVEVGSSRNYSHPSVGFDFSQNAAVNVALCARPQSIPGLEVGFSSYHDRFSPLQGYRMSRSVWTAHAVYQAHRVEFLNEAVLAKFRNPTDGFATVPGFYSQISYRTGASWRPYFRYDYVNARGRGLVGDYAPQIVPWRTAATGGVRYDLSDAIALKFELVRENDRLQTPWVQAGVQVAFTF